MRIAAGILMILVGTDAPAIGGIMMEMTGMMRMSAELAAELGATMAVILGLVLLALVLTWGGAICAFKRKIYWWAMAGAICAVIIGLLSFFMHEFWGFIFSTMAILALVFLVDRKDEFQA